MGLNWYSLFMIKIVEILSDEISKKDDNVLDLVLQMKNLDSVICQ